MPNNSRALILANSVYQLLTAVHLRRSLLRDRETDLILTDVTPALSECLPRLRETGLFDRVLFAAVQTLHRRYAGAGEEGLSECFRERERIFQWVLSEELAARYGQVYFANFDLFTRLLACRFYEDDCEFLWFEDGFSSYVIDYLREDRAPVNRHPQGRKVKDKVERVLLYEPRLAMRGDGLKNVALPKIPIGDEALKTLLNTIFAYQPPKDSADFIFLEQSFRAEGIKTNDLSLIEECRNAVGPGRFVVKPHPRNPHNLPQQLGLTRRYPGNAPWELFLLNEGPAGKTILTVCSNAALTGRIVFGMDLNTVMLYPLFEGKVLWKEDAVLLRYLQKFRRQFAGENYYVPQTVYQLRSILHYLGGQNGQQH